MALAVVVASSTTGGSSTGGGATAMAGIVDATDATAGITDRAAPARMARRLRFACDQ